MRTGDVHAAQGRPRQEVAEARPERLAPDWKQRANENWLIAEQQREERRITEALFRGVRIELAHEMSDRIKQELEKIRHLRDKNGDEVGEQLKLSLVMALHSAISPNPTIAMNGRRLYLATLEQAIKRKLDRSWRKAAYGTEKPDRPALM